MRDLSTSRFTGDFRDAFQRYLIKLKWATLRDKTSLNVVECCWLLFRADRCFGQVRTRFIVRCVVLTLFGTRTFRRTSRLDRTLERVIINFTVNINLPSIVLLDRLSRPLVRSSGARVALDTRSGLRERAWGVLLLRAHVYEITVDRPGQAVLLRVVWC